jgi:DNA-binding Lrp family transcriptional regulator
MDALTNIAAAAQEIAAERQRLNAAFDGLLKAALAISNGEFGLDSDGNTKRMTSEPPAPAPEPAPAPAKVVAPASKPTEPNLKTRIFDVLGDDRMTAQAVAFALGEQDVDRITNNMRQLKAKGELLRDDRSRYFKPGAVTVKKPAPAPAPVDGYHSIARAPKPLSEMKQQQRESEERKIKLVEFLQENSPTNTHEVADALGYSDNMVSVDLRELLKRGAIESTGRNVFSKRQMAKHYKERGRSTPEYKALDVSPKAVGSLTPEKIRDVARTLIRFNLSDLIAKTADVRPTPMNQAIAKAILDEMVGKGMLTYDGEYWEYVKPSEPGAAALHDAKRVREVSVTSDGAPVAGTGKNNPIAQAMRRASGEVQQVIKQLQNRGEAKIDITAEGHFLVTGKGEKIIMAPKPNSRGLAKDKARLRRAGLITA